MVIETIKLKDTYFFEEKLLQTLLFSHSVLSGSVRPHRLQHARLPVLYHLPEFAQIHQARLQQYMNCELPDIQAGFRKGRGTRDQIANISWIIEKQGNSRKISPSASLSMLKPLCESQQTVDSSSKEWNTRFYLPPEKPVCSPERGMEQ